MSKFYLPTDLPLQRCPGWQIAQPCEFLAGRYSFHSGPRLCRICAANVLRQYLKP